MTPRQHRFILTATFALLLAPAAFAVDTNGTWNVASGGSWGLDTNWASNTIADGSGFTAFFNTQDITANTTVTLDGARMIGNLTLGDTDPLLTSAFSWILNTGTGGPLTLAGATPTISVTLGVSQNSTINAVLAGTSGFTKSGTSVLLLGNAGNTISGPVVISQGNIQLNAPALKFTTSLAINGGNLVLATTQVNPIGGTISFGGGNLQYNSIPGTDLSAQFSTAANQAYRINLAVSTTVATFNTNLSSPGGTLLKLGGGGKLTLAAANTFDGATTLNGGNLVLSNALAIQNSPIATSASGTGNGTATLGYILSGVTAPVFGGLTGTRALINIFDTDAEGGFASGGYAGVTNLTLNPGSGASYSYSGIIVDGAVGMTLTKTGAGTQALTVANSYTGETAINGGILAIGNADALGTTGTISFGGGTLQHNFVATDLSSRFSTAASQAYSVNTNGQNVTWASALTSSGGTLAKSGNGTLTLSGGLTNTIAGAINVNGGTLLFQGGSAMSGTITVASGAVFSFNQAFVDLNTLPNVLNLSGPGAGTSGALNLYGNAIASGPITLDADTTITKSFNNGTISGSVTGTNRNLTLKTTVAGVQPALLISAPITLGTGGITVAAVPAIPGETNIVTLSGNNSYSGETYVQTGTLRLTGAARINDSSTARIDTGAVLDLDFAGTDTVAALFIGGAPKPAGTTYGSLASSAANKSADFLGAGILQVGAAANNYASWAITNGIGGEPFVGDFNMDGISNGVAYALGLSPTLSSQPAGVLLGTTITFTKGADAIANADVTWIIETSLTLSGSWLEEVIQAPGNATTTISYNLNPVPGTPKKFARLKAVKVP